MKFQLKTRKATLVTGLVLLAAVALAATIVGSHGTFTTSESNGKITTTYSPNVGNPTCSSIYMVQTCRDVDQNGNVVSPKDYQGNTFDHLQDDMTPGGTYVDHVVCEKDPYYNGEDPGKDKKSEGSNSASSSTPTTMSDKPNYSDNCFPTGVTTIVSTFEVCAVCADDGRILDCYTWTYTRVKGDGTNGTVSSGTTAAPASDEFKLALGQFELNHLYGLICTEEVAEQNMGMANVAYGGATTEPAVVIPEEPFVMQFNVVNLSGVDVFEVEYEVLLDGMFWSMGQILELPYFDSEIVYIELPPLPEGPHEMLLSLDPMQSIPEYNEEDNIGIVEFEISGLSPVMEEDAATGIFMQLLQPNPTHGDFNVMLRLGSDAPARLTVIDIRGRLVTTRAVHSVAGELHTEHFHLDSSLGAGMYFLRLEQGDLSETRKFIMLR
jgi:hypothetical protein